jgi:hypothetical protein
MYRIVIVKLVCHRHKPIDLIGNNRFCLNMKLIFGVLPKYLQMNYYAEP